MSSPSRAIRRSASCCSANSLGTGVAIALAADRKVGRIILQAPFTSAAEIGAAAYPFLPVRLLMKDQFRSDERIGKVKVPLLILHGAFDRVVPMAFGERLLALANEPKRLVRFPRGGHNDLDSQGAQAVVREFLSESGATGISCGGGGIQFKPPGCCDCGVFGCNCGGGRLFCSSRSMRFGRSCADWSGPQ